MKLSDVLTLQEAADYLKISYSNLQRMVQTRPAQAPPHFRIGTGPRGVYRFNLDEVDCWRFSQE